MQKIMLVLMLIMTISLTGCGGISVSEEGEMEVGYSNGGGDAKDFAGYLAFTISDDSLETGESTNILFEYGHDFNQEEYYKFESAFTIAIYLTKSSLDTYPDNGEYNLLYEESIDDFASDDYKVDVNSRNIFDKPEYNQSIELTLSSVDFPFEIGVLYYQLSFEEVSSDDITYTVHRAVYFTNYDGILIFTKDNPF